MYACNCVHNISIYLLLCHTIYYYGTLSTISLLHIIITHIIFYLKKCPYHSVNVMTLLVCIVVSFYISNMNALPAIFKLEASAALHCSLEQYF